jgi:hypothetical protein
MTESIIEKTFKDPDVNIIDNMRIAYKECNVSISKQFLDIIKLQFSFNKISPAEYFYYQLYKLPDAEKNKFLGKMSQDKLFLYCTSLHWLFLAHDKLVFYAAMKGLGFPIPNTQAVFHQNRAFGTAELCTDAASLKTFLLEKAQYPLFGKPISGMWSVGVSKIDGLTPEKQIRLHDGQIISCDKFIEEISHFYDSGYLFQDTLKPHSQVAKICGDRIATIRFIVALKNNGPEILHSIWKIPAGGNLADNFWREGNLLAAINTEDGKIERAVRGFGSDQDLLEQHPDTGARLTGEKLSLWSEAKSLCLEAAATIPGLKLQAWDIALCSEGAALLELNVGGDFNLPQIANGKGLWDGEFKSFVEDCKNDTESGWNRRRKRKADNAITR